jgi:hypothetical protein
MITSGVRQLPMPGAEPMLSVVTAMHFLRGGCRIRKAADTLQGVNAFAWKSQPASWRKFPPQCSVANQGGQL